MLYVWTKRNESKNENESKNNNTQSTFGGHIIYFPLSLPPSFSIPICFGLSSFAPSPLSISDAMLDMPKIFYHSGFFQFHNTV